MKIISWDIGIKNLAYCILEENINDIIKPFKIHEWNNINLIDNMFCCSEKDCSNKVCYKCDSINESYYYCVLHKNNFINLKNDLNDIESLDSENNCSCEITLKSGLKCQKKLKSNIKINIIVIYILIK